MLPCMSSRVTMGSTFRRRCQDFNIGTLIEKAFFLHVKGYQINCYQCFFHA